MSDRPVIQSAPNYTDAFLGSFGVLLFTLLTLIPALFGMLWVGMTAWGLTRWINWLGRRGS